MLIANLTLPFVPALVSAQSEMPPAAATPALQVHPRLKVYSLIGEVATADPAARSLIVKRVATRWRS
jgi:hypothetical protein